MSDPASILQIITLGVSGWVLLEVVGIKERLAAMNQKMKDLPCDTCNESDDRQCRPQKKSDAQEKEIVNLCEV